MGSAAAGRGARMIAAIASPAPAATRVALVAVMLPPVKPVLMGWKGARVRPGWAVSAALLARAVKHKKAQNPADHRQRSTAAGPAVERREKKVSTLWPA